MPVRMRATLKATGDRVGELQTAANLRRDLWAHLPVEMDPDHPLHGTHCDEQGRAYFEFATAVPQEVRQLVEGYHYADRVELTETTAVPGDECANCGNIAGPVLPTVCPNCAFRDISPCPIGREEVPRQLYTRIAGDHFCCPHCNSQVRLRFNNPMFLPDGHQDSMQRVAEMKHCGLHRDLSAFIYPDWLSARKRYDYDLRKVVAGVEGGQLPSPGDAPIPVQASSGTSPGQPGF